MASSSRPLKRLSEADSSNDFVPGKSGNYDVFLSHRGPDTKTGFTAHLREKLKGARLETYIDCRDFEKGENSWESIERAIKNTQVGLVVFSENFADSKWCLKELHLMLKTPTITVHPIFYKVKPGDVRHSLGEARVAELRKQGCSMADIELWRKDLETASRRGGWEYERNDKRLEPEFQDLIVEEVSKLRNKALVSNGASEEGLVGVDLVAEQIIEELDVKEVGMLGLWGMGGIGKTTLAWEIYSRLRKRGDYSASCCVKDVSEKVRQIDGVERVQEDILKGLCKGVGAEKIQNNIDGRNILEGRLCKKGRFVLLLDDVSNEKDMMQYIMSPKMLEGGSMCIVTTRDKGVLEAFGRRCDNVCIHAVGQLSEEDSRRVFAYYAFGGDDKVNLGFESLVDGISKACGGVPLLLKVIGSSLDGNEDVEAWREVWDCGDISKGHVGVYDRLRTSYDRLSEEQREMFLDIACGLIGEPMDLACRVWRSLNWKAKVNVQLLVKCALVSLDDEGRFVMHDVLRDMGRAIEMEKKPKERARMWMPESLTRLMEKKELPKRLQILVMNYSSFHDKLTIDVSHMKELRILRCCDSATVTSIPPNLRWLSFRRIGNFKWKPMSFAEIPQGNKLVVLDLGHLINIYNPSLGLYRPQCNIPGLGGATALECVYLRDCDISELPDLQRLSKLEELDISGSIIKSVFWLGYLVALVKFDARRCFILVELPDIGKLTRLQELHLPPAITAVPGLFKILPNLTELFVNAEGLETTDVVNATKLVVLTVCDWKESWPGAGINFATLMSLAVSGLGSRTKTLDGLLEMKNLVGLLESIEVVQFGSLDDVSCLNRLTALRSISISYCDSLEILPDLLELTRLETLTIRRCRCLREWTLLRRWRSLSGPVLPSLQTLKFFWVAMKEVPDNLKVMFPRLRTAYVANF